MLWDDIACRVIEVAIIAAHQSLSVIESSQRSRRKDTVQNEVIRRAVKPASKETH